MSDREDDLPQNVEEALSAGYVLAHPHGEQVEGTDSVIVFHPTRRFKGDETIIDALWFGEGIFGTAAIDLAVISDLAPSVEEALAGLFSGWWLRNCGIDVGSRALLVQFMGKDVCESLIIGQKATLTDEEIVRAIAREENHECKA